MISSTRKFLVRHQVSGSRIAGISTALATHIVMGLVIAIPLQHGSSVPEPEEVTQVVFVESSGKAPVVVAPPPPPPPTPPAPREAPRPKREAPQPPSVAEAVDAVIAPEGEVAVDTMLLGSSPEFDELADINLPQPDVPASEILSYRRAFQPTYPPEARAAGEGGWVILKVLVDAEGLPLAFLPVKSSATQRLVDAAIEAVKKWRFNPAQKDGAPVAAWVEVPIGFWSSPRTAAQ